MHLCAPTRTRPDGHKFARLISAAGHGSAKVSFYSTGFAASAVRVLVVTTNGNGPKVFTFGPAFCAEAPDSYRTFGELSVLIEKSDLPTKEELLDCTLAKTDAEPLGRSEIL